MRFLAAHNPGKMGTVYLAMPERMVLAGRHEALGFLPPVRVG